MRDYHEEDIMKTQHDRYARMRTDTPTDEPITNFETVTQNLLGMSYEVLGAVRGMEEKMFGTMPEPVPEKEVDRPRGSYGRAEQNANQILRILSQAKDRIAKLAVSL